MAEQAEKIFTLADALLDAMVARFQTHGRPLPDYRFVTAGQVAYDCELFAVSYIGLSHAIPGQSAVVIKGPVPRHVIFQMHLVRCVPIPNAQGTPPTADELNGSATEVARDALILGREPVKAYADSDFSSHCDSVILTGQDTVGPEGGFLGLRQDLAVQI